MRGLVFLCLLCWAYLIVVCGMRVNWSCWGGLVNSCGLGSSLEFAVAFAVVLLPFADGAFVP